MTDIIEAHGFKFAIEAQGFASNHAEADRDTGVEAIRTALSDMQPNAVAALHTAAAQWVADDCRADEPDDLGRLAQIGWEAATVGWHKPDAVYFSVSAA